MLDLERMAKQGKWLLGGYGKAGQYRAGRKRVKDQGRLEEDAPTWYLAPRRHLLIIYRLHE